MTVKENELYILHLDEAVGTYTDEYDDLMAKYKNKLGKDQTIFEYSKSGAYEDNIYYIVTEKKVSFEFELGVTLNYKTYSRTINDLNGKQFSMNDVTMTINNICAKSFGLEVDATVSAIPFPEMPELDGTDPADSIALHNYQEKIDSLGFIIEFDITMKDGSKVTAQADSRLLPSRSDRESKDLIQCNYEKDGVHAAIDPDDIVSITATAKPREK